MPVSQQFAEVVRPFYRRVKRAPGADPGKLRMLTFLPDHADELDDYVLARAGDSLYAANYGFDVGAKRDKSSPSGFSGGRGLFTVGDVIANTEEQIERAHGRRMMPAADPSPIPSPSPAPQAPPPTPIGGNTMNTGQILGFVSEVDARFDSTDEVMTTQFALVFTGRRGPIPFDYDAWKKLFKSWKDWSQPYRYSGQGWLDILTGQDRPLWVSDGVYDEAKRFDDQRRAYYTELGTGPTVPKMVEPPPAPTAAQAAEQSKKENPPDEKPLIDFGGIGTGLAVAGAVITVAMVMTRKG